MFCCIREYELGFETMLDVVHAIGGVGVESVRKKREGFVEINKRKEGKKKERTEIHDLYRNWSEMNHTDQAWFAQPRV
jgi:hypothetical protein